MAATNPSLWSSPWILLTVVLVTAGQTTQVNRTEAWRCPAGYRLTDTVRLCTQKSCLALDLTTNGTGSDHVAATAASESCAEPTSSYVTCRKIFLTSGQYVIDLNDLSLRVPEVNLSIPLGDFVLLEADVASVCLTERTGKIVRESNPRYSDDVANSLPTSCMPLTVASEDVKTSADGTARAFDDTKSFRPNFHFVRSDNLTDACHDMITCHKNRTIHKNQLRFLPNMDVQEGALGDVFPLGMYVLPHDVRGRVVICAESTELPYGMTSIVSAVFLLLAVLVHFLLPTMNQHATALLGHMLSMFVAYVAFSVNYLVNMSKWPLFYRYVVFVVTYTSALSSFLWLSVLAFDLWRVFARLRPKQHHRKKTRLLAQCAYAVGIPCLLSVPLVVINADDKLRASLGIPDKSSLQVIFLYVPVLIILIANCIFFGLTVVNMRAASSGTQILDKKVGRQLFHVFVKLFVVMGLTWLAEIVSMALELGPIARVTSMVNALLGVVIFLIYVCKMSTFRAMKKRFGARGVRGSSTMSTSTDVPAVDTTC